MTARRLLPSQGFTEEKLRLRKGKWLTGCHMSSLVPEPSLTHDPEIHILTAFNPVVWLTQISSNCVHLLAKLALQICIEVYTYPSSANQEFPFPYSLHQPIRSSFPLTPFISQSGVPFPALHYLITTSIYLLVNMGHYATCVVVRGHRSGIDLLSSTWAPGMEGGGQECSLNLLTACPILIHDVFSRLGSLTELFSRFQPQQ